MHGDRQVSNASSPAVQQAFFSGREKNKNVQAQMHIEFEIFRTSQPERCGCLLSQAM